MLLSQYHLTSNLYVIISAFQELYIFCVEEYQFPWWK
jgi:hypothetical protein